MLNVLKEAYETLSSPENKKKYDDNRVDDDGQEIVDENQTKALQTDIHFKKYGLWEILLIVVFGLIFIEILVVVIFVPIPWAWSAFLSLMELILANWFWRFFLGQH